MIVQVELLSCGSVNGSRIHGLDRWSRARLQGFLTFVAPNNMDMRRKHHRTSNPQHPSLLLTVWLIRFMKRQPQDVRCSWLLVRKICLPRANSPTSSPAQSKYWGYWNKYKASHGLISLIYYSDHIFWVVIDFITAAYLTLFLLLIFDTLGFSEKRGDDPNVANPISGAFTKV